MHLLISTQLLTSGKLPSKSLLLNNHSLYSYTQKDDSTYIMVEYIITHQSTTILSTLIQTPLTWTT